MNELDRLRQEIDEIDKEIVGLIEKRMEISKRVGEYKKANHLPFLDSDREKQVLKNRMEMLSNKDIKDEVQELFEHIMKISRSYQGGK